MTGDASLSLGIPKVSELRIDARQILQFQGEPQFLRGQSARGQAGTDLIEQTIQQEGQRLQQHNRKFQLNSFFKHRRRFHGNQRARSRCASRQICRKRSPSLS